MPYPNFRPEFLTYFYNISADKWPTRRPNWLLPYYDNLSLVIFFLICHIFKSHKTVSFELSGLAHAENYGINIVP